MIRALAILAVVLFAGSVGTQQQAKPIPVPVGTPAELGLAGYVKVLCSAVFVSGRDPDEASRNSAYWWLQPPSDLEKVTFTVDRERKLVRASIGSVTREARFFGDQGCVLPANGRIYFTPVAVRTSLPDAASQPWPMGD